MLCLDAHDHALVERVRRIIDGAIARAHNPIAVTKRFAVLATGRRNRGRSVAMRRHPFSGVCEKSGQPLAREHAHLDELQPELGYAGPVRWVCQRANNSGRPSCGVCK